MEANETRGRDNNARLFGERRKNPSCKKKKRKVEDGRRPNLKPAVRVNGGGKKAGDVRALGRSTSESKNMRKCRERGEKKVVERIIYLLGRSSRSGMYTEKKIAGARRGRIVWGGPPGTGKKTWGLRRCGGERRYPKQQTLRNRGRRLTGSRGKPVDGSLTC